MLELTPDAARLAVEVRTQQHMSENASLRVTATTEDEPGNFALGFVKAPTEGDQIGEAHGLSYCVAADVADRLDESILDTTSSGPDEHFILRTSTE